MVYISVIGKIPYDKKEPPINERVGRHALMVIETICTFS